MSLLNNAYVYTHRCLLKYAQVRKPVQNGFRHFGWNGRFQQDLLPFSKAKAAHEYTSKRKIGWMLAPKLKPGQRGYEKQQKMHKILAVVYPFMGFGFIYFLYKIGLYSPMWMSSESFYNIHRDNAEKIKAKKEAVDNELLRLAEIRKKNAELYPPIKSGENEAPKS